MKRCPGSRRRPTAVALALAGWTSGVAAQEAGDVTILEPCGTSCGVTLVLEGEYGEDSGPGMIEATMARAWRDASGRVYVTGESAPHVWVFGADGSFLRRIGRQGSGPGEFQYLHSLTLVDDGVFAALDSGRGAILTYDWTGQLQREVRTQGWLPLGFQTIHFEGDLAVSTAEFHTPENVGYPLHLIDLGAGTIRKSFGSRTGDYPLGTRLVQRSIARGPNRTVWMARITAYEIELWEPNRLLRTLRRDVDWFPDVKPDEGGHGMEAKPTPVFAHMASDDSLLWVFLYTADERWAQAAETQDRDLYLDTTIEVIDWRRGQVVASRRLDEEFDAWLEPGLAGRLAVTQTGDVRYRTYRVRLH